MTDEIEPLVDSAELLRESLALNPDCCGNDAWRGRLCPYHSGYRDALETVAERIESGREFTDEFGNIWRWERGRAVFVRGSGRRIKPLIDSGEDPSRT